MVRAHLREGIRLLKADGERQLENTRLLDKYEAEGGGGFTCFTCSTSLREAERDREREREEGEDHGNIERHFYIEGEASLC